VVYDGGCLLCNRWVAFVLRHDRDGKFQFTTLNSETARARIPDPEQRDGTTLLLTPEGIFDRSTAALKVASELRGYSALARLLLKLPKSLRDSVYDFIARHRHAILPRRNASCAFIPGSANRFLP
jgi:predicted DCC family thiol-disulfide oxidoreductase YuxK